MGTKGLLTLAAIAAVVFIDGIAAVVAGDPVPAFQFHIGIALAIRLQ